MDVDTPSNLLPNFVDSEQIVFRRFDPPSYVGLPCHFDPYNPDKCFSDWPTFSKPGPPSPSNPQLFLRHEFSCTSYPGDITKYVPFDPENFDPESFFFGRSSAEPAEFNLCDPKLHPQDPKLLDNGFDDPLRDPKLLDVSFDDQSPAGENVGGCVQGNGEADKPVNTCDNKFVDISKGKLTNVESSGTAANEWNKKESCSASKTAWSTPAEEETWGSVGEELSRGTGYFARKCSLGADGNKSGSHGSGSIGRELCNRMP